MSFPSVVQSVESGSVSGNGKTFGSADGWKTPASGNVIIVYSACSSGTSNLAVPDGYTDVGRSVGGGGAGRPRVACFAKVSDGTESDVQVEWNVSDEQWVAIVQELDADDIGLGKNNNGTNGSEVTELLTNETVETEGFAVALFASAAQNEETPSADNDFVHTHAVLAGESTDLVLDVFESNANEESADTYSTTATWTSSENRGALCIAFDIPYVNGEKVKEYQRSSSYRVVDLDGKPAYVDGPGNGIELVGLNRGQAKKHLKTMVGFFNFKVESV